MGRSVCRCGTTTGPSLKLIRKLSVGEDGEETEPAITVEGLQAALDCVLWENKRLKTQLEQQQETLEKERGLMGLHEEEKRKLEGSASPARVSELEGELKREKK